MLFTAEIRKVVRVENVEGLTPRRAPAAESQDANQNQKFVLGGFRDPG